MTDCKKLTIAWLVPNQALSENHYWTPFLLEFRDIFTNVTFITVSDKIHPENRKMFNICAVGSCKWVSFKKNPSGYETGFQIVSPAIIFKLLRLKPRLIIVQEWGLWTVLAADHPKVAFMEVIERFYVFIPDATAYDYETLAKIYRIQKTVIETGA